MENISGVLPDSRKFFVNLQGKKCWSVVAGSGTGSMVSLGFGEKIPRKVRIRNPTLSEEQQMFFGEFCVFIRNSSWLVIKEEKIICSNEDSNERGGAMLEGLSKLIGASVVCGNVKNERGDFELLFDNAISLKVECTDDEVNNYTLFDSEENTVDHR